MSSLLKKFTSDNINENRIPRRDEELNNFQRPRDFVSSPPVISRPTETNRTNLCSDVEIKGTLSFKDYLRMDGKFEGEVLSAGTFLVGENGEVKAEIVVGNLIVEGKVYGNVVATDKIELRSTAQLFGDIKAARLIIAEGVVFVGKSDVNPSQKIEKFNAPPAEVVQISEASESTPVIRDNLY